MTKGTRAGAVALAALAALGIGATDFLHAQSAGQAPNAAAPAASALVSGVREAVFTPDGKRLVVTWFDQLWTMTADGASQQRLVMQSGAPAAWTSERDPQVSPDGKTVAFAAETHGQFDIWTAPIAGGKATRITTTEGDERWPSFTRDGRLVFAHREPHGRWQIFAAPMAGGAPTRVTTDDAAEWQPRVSPDGKWVAFVSDRDSDVGDIDVFVRALGGANARPVRVTKNAAVERFPAWAPDSTRVAYESGIGTQAMVWVQPVPAASPTDTTGGPGQGRGGRGFGGRGGNNAADPADAAVLASKHGGVPAWSPDGETLAIATFTPADPQYNGDPLRNDDDRPMLFGDAKDYTLWRLAAPRAVDANAKTIVTTGAPLQAQFAATFDRVWTTLKSLYYSTGERAAAWDALREKYRGQTVAAKSATAAEDVIDRMVAEQPLIKNGASGRVVITSGNPLASAAGAEVIAKGGNIVDAAIAVDFALGVTEPDASSIGGDGMCLLYLKGMSEPIAIDFKDMTPGHATGDNPKIFNPNGSRTAVDGPSVTNIPGIVAGMDLLYQKYASKKVAWADILAPAIKIADEGFILDEALPTTVAEGRAQFAKYPESMKVFMPGGKMPKAGDRFVNKDYAETLRTLAKEGAQSFYRGSIAKRIVEDFAANGGIITAEDLAQYHAVERTPVHGMYRGNKVYSAPPPVTNGADLIEKLQILNNYTPKPGASYANDADFLHYVIDSWRVKDGGTRIADPDHWPIEYGDHLTPAHAADRYKLLSRDKVFVAQGGRGGGSASPLAALGSPQVGSASPLAAPLDGSEDETRHVQTGTTSFALADGEGNMIVFTQTLSTWGGNYYVSKDLGFLYNDHFRGGRAGTGYGSMLPLMRSSSTSVPTMVFAPQGSGFVPKMAVGCAGNSWIPASVYDIIVNVIDSKMDAQHAIEAPRMLIGNGPDGKARTTIEDRVPRAILDDLAKRGHTFVKNGRKGEVREGYASVVIVDLANGTAQAGAEPRRSHGAVSKN